MQTAEGGKENSRRESQGNSQEHRQELVDHVFAHFKESMAADPHFVKGVRRHWFCNHILESHLRRQDSGILNCHPTCLTRNQEYSRKTDLTGMPHLLLGSRWENRNLVKNKQTKKKKILVTQAAPRRESGPQTLRGWPSGKCGSWGRSRVEEAPSS